MSTRTSAAERRFYNLLTIIFAVPIAAAVLFWSAWWVMLGLGAAHGQWPVVPAVDYWTTYLILAGISSTVSLLRWNPGRTERDGD